MSERLYKREFEEGLKEVSVTAAFVKEPIDRMKLTEWMKKLIEIPSETLENVVLKNEYVQFLRIALKNKGQTIFAPFDDFPPQDELISLAKYLGNKMVESSSSFPDGGPIQPILCHQSDDCTATLTIQRCPEGGIFCYMAVAPDGLK